MPKLKRASSSYSLSQAKKRKKTQRDDPVRRHQERLRDSLRRQRHSSSSYSRNDRQERRRLCNTEERQTSRLDPERRTEQERDTAARRLSRQDPHRRIEEQQINNAQCQVRGSRLASLRALNYEADNFHNTTNVGTLNVECLNCGAIKFPMETASLCCSKGNVKLDAYPQPQPFLQHLYEGTNSDGKHFLANIRKYNCAFQMTSFGCNEITMAGFNPSFRVQGQVYHLIGSIVPSTGESPTKFTLLTINNHK